MWLVYYLGSVQRISLWREQLNAKGGASMFGSFCFETPGGATRYLISKMATVNNEHVDRQGLFEKLKELGIETTTVDHPEVCTMW